jgi:hypothetical protein
MLKSKCRLFCLGVRRLGTIESAIHRIIVFSCKIRVTQVRQLCHIIAMRRDDIKEVPNYF